MRSVKMAYKSLGTRVLTRVQWQTTLCEVEFCVNSRPLTFVGDKPDYPYVISPAHFLIPQPEIPSPITDPRGGIGGPSA